MKNEQDADLEIIIHSNGSKWAGQNPDTINVLLDVLKTKKLDINSFCLLGFVSYCEGKISCFGNFLEVSHVFNIEGPEESPLMKELVHAIEDNIKRQREATK